MKAQTPQKQPIHRQLECEAMSCAQSTAGQKGMMVNTRMATYLPRCEVGANSDVTASAVSSLMPAPTPEKTIPQMKMFMVCAVEQTIIPKMRKQAPIMATQRRPTMSEIDPTNGQTAARDSRFARMNQIHRSTPPMSAYTYGGTPPKR